MLKNIDHKAGGDQIGKSHKISAVIMFSRRTSLCNWNHLTGQ